MITLMAIVNLNMISLMLTERIGIIIFMMSVRTVAITIGLMRANDISIDMVVATMIRDRGMQMFVDRVWVIKISLLRIRLP